MKVSKTNAWISCYIYDTGSLDQLLTNNIWPFVRRLNEEQLIRQFFFIRYVDTGGPHIRLRLLPDKSLSRQSIRKRVKTRFPDAKFVTYIPEIERYGGSEGLNIAERLFEASSLAVLRLIAIDKPWNYGRALASAAQMNLGMLQAFGVSRAEVVALCAHLAQSNLVPGRPDEHFERGFAAQRETIVPQFAALWDACEKSVDFKDQWFADWRQAMNEVGSEMRRANNEDKLILVESAHHDDALWYLYESYIHMTNNRLGVKPPDESFLAYLLQRSLGKHN